MFTAINMLYPALITERVAGANDIRCRTMSTRLSRERQTLSTSLLLKAYAVGLFPMAETRDSEHIYWVEPRKRGILPLGRFYASHSLKRTLKREQYFHTHDLVFEAVVRHCAAATRGREESWINRTILEACIRLHRQGYAHSIETWTHDGRLAGGLYGITLGAAFFGESMFSRATDASKAALCHLAVRLRRGGYRLLDTQFTTPHLAAFGGMEIKRREYLRLLNSAITQPANWNSLDDYERPPLLSDHTHFCHARGSADQLDVPPEVTVPPELLADLGPSGRLIVQLLSQTS